MATIKSVKVKKGYELRLVEGRTVLHAVTYWPDQQASVNAAYDLLNAEANRLGVDVS